MSDTLPPVVGITGLAGSGKTTAANWMLREHGNVIKMAFARPLKRMIYELMREVIPKNLPVTPKEYLDDPVLKNEPLPFLANQSPRRLMQTLGTEWGRQAVHEDFWVMIAAAKVERLLGSGALSSTKPGIKAVFDDLRFQNEGDMVRAFGGMVIRIERPGQPKMEHASEMQYVAPDHVVINDGTEEELIAKLSVILPLPEKG
jgi:hypothetical protein